MTFIPQVTARGHPVRVHIVGGGPMGLLAATELAELAQAMELRTECTLYEAAAFGGGPNDRTSAARSQLWGHMDGQLWAGTQPHVSLELQQSTRRLRELCPTAFSFPLALAIEPPHPDRPPLEYCFTALDIWHRPVAEAAVRSWFPALRFPTGCRFWRVRDAVMDQRLLSYALTQRARQSGVALVNRGVHGLGLQASQIRSLTLDNGERVEIRPGDVVVLACSSTIRPLLAGVGLSVPGLRVFRSHLLATDAFRLPALLSVSWGGPNCVPHDESGASPLNVFGNSERWPCAPETDGTLLRPDPDAIERIHDDVAHWFGLTVPRDCLSWAARKVEIIPPDEARSQSHHCVRVLDNCVVALPGKISQAAAAGQHLARMILRERVPTAIARPIWEASFETSPRAEVATLLRSRDSRRWATAAGSLAAGALAASAVLIL